MREEEKGDIATLHGAHTTLKQHSSTVAPGTNLPSPGLTGGEISYKIIIPILITKKESLLSRSLPYRKGY